MSTKLSTTLLVTLTLAAGFASSGTRAADLPGRHPAYLHALSDLYLARWNLEHRPGDAAVSGQEDIAITEIDRAIQEARRAAGDDGKNVNEHPHEDAVLDHPGRLRHALDLLHSARADLHEREDNPETRNRRDLSAGHIDTALRATEQAIKDFEHEHHR